MPYPHLLRSDSKYQLDTRSSDILFDVFVRTFRKRKKKCEVGSHVITCRSKGSEIFICPPITAASTSLLLARQIEEAHHGRYFCVVTHELISGSLRALFIPFHVLFAQQHLDLSSA